VNDDRPELPRPPGSIWLANTGGPSFPPLVRDRRCDVVVVGAGVAGLSTALLASRAGRDVVVLDAGTIGDGVTGSTTGKVSLLQSTRYSDIEETHGPQVARRYADANRAGQEQLVRWAEELAPGARLQRAVGVTATTEASAVGRIQREADAASRAGLDVTLLHDEHLGLPFALSAAVTLPDQVHIDAVPYLRALALAVEHSGGTVHEHSRVMGLTGLEGRGVTTATAAVEADHVVVTTGMPMFDRAGWFARAYPSRSYAIAVALADGATVPMDGFFGIDTPTWSLRPAWDPRDGRLLLCVGGGRHVTGREAHPLAEQKRLAAWAANRFDVEEVRYRWSAQDYRVDDRLPAYGPMWALPTRVLVATGFDKWGLTNGTAAGLALAGTILGERPDWAAPFDTRRLNLRAGVPTFLKENAGIGVRLVKDWATGGASRAPDTGPGTPAAAGRAGYRPLPLAARAIPDDAGLDPVQGEADAAGEPLTSDPEGLAEGHGVVVRRGLDLVGIARVDGRLEAVRAVCTHLGGVLTWNDAECSWDCPLHGSRFDPQGRVLQAPACRDLSTRRP
jgi:glycine/D-amino acid oxidase-like deaminating enzyme/Rieske Fe-S protein